MNERHIVPRGATTDATRCKPHSLSLQSLHGNRQIVHPDTNMVEGGNVDLGSSLWIKRLHQVELYRPRAIPQLEDVLVNILFLRLVGADLLHAE